MLLNWSKANMMNRRILAFSAILVTGAFAVLGAAMFIIGLLSELLSRSNDGNEGVSLAVQFALAGLCLAGAMFLSFFALVAALIARQARERGAGYGDAYRLIEAFRFREAIPLLESAVRAGHETSDILMLLTSAYGYAGQLGKAQATADRAVQMYPQSSQSYVTLATGYKLQGAYEEAAEALREALNREPDQAPLWAELGFVQRFAGHREQSTESFQQALKLGAMPAMYAIRVNFHLMQEYQAVGNTAEAVRAAARMVSARAGLAVWHATSPALAGTAYGTALHYELADIDRALREADSGRTD
jgi:tetratricopeptide (TPR) repeat protein